MTKTTLEIGVDEAGRGAVLGPLVLAACALDPDAAEALRGHGVMDSKAYGSPGKAQGIRTALAEHIRSLASWWALRAVPPAEVDAAVRRSRLNALEREVAASLLDGAPAGARVIFDGARLFADLAARLPRAEARNQAETSCTAVAAASILAKTERDRLFAAIRSRHEPAYGAIGGEGYPNAATRRFLEAYVAAEGTLPPETRRSWSWPPVASRVTPAERGEAPAFDFGD